MSAERFVYVTYSASTAEKVFRALLDGELTRQYWKHTNESDWKPGSKWRSVTDDGKGTVRIVGSVVEMVPNRLGTEIIVEPAIFEQSLPDPRPEPPLEPAVSAAAAPPAEEAETPVQSQIQVAGRPEDTGTPAALPSQPPDTPLREAAEPDEAPVNGDDRQAESGLAPSISERKQESGQSGGQDGDCL